MNTSGETERLGVFGVVIASYKGSRKGEADVGMIGRQYG